MKKQEKGTIDILRKSFYTIKFIDKNISDIVNAVASKSADVSDVNFDYKTLRLTFMGLAMEGTVDFLQTLMVNVNKIEQLQLTMLSCEGQPVGSFIFNGLKRLSIDNCIFDVDDKDIINITLTYSFKSFNVC